MAKKPVPKGQTAKHSAAAKPKAKHPAAKTSTKHAQATKKTATKHKPAAKPKKETLAQQVQALVKQDVQKDLKAIAKKAAAPLAPRDLACCVPQALAESLRMAGHRVTDDDVLEFFTLAGGDPDEGLTIPEALDAAWIHGLAGAYPSYGLAGDLSDGDLVLFTIPAGIHAATVDGPGVRTWGEWRPASLVPAIEEAWAVTW
jgi:hypothetical protein